MRSKSSCGYGKSFDPLQTTVGHPTFGHTKLQTYRLGFVWPMDSGNAAEYMAVCQNLVPLVNIKIAGKWMFIPLKMVLIGIDPYPYCFFLYLPGISWG